LAAAIVVGAVALLLPRFGRDRRLHEVDRFHRAGQITSGWARDGVTQPVLVDEAAPRESAPREDAAREEAAEPAAQRPQAGASGRGRSRTSAQH
jgi:hypothetical protein